MPVDSDKPRSRIVQLPLEVVTKIAAGEVIERPASVVKELLENSVDAGARRIDIDVEQGGAELIRVVDDGGGIAAADLPLAFANHATSKLQSADDLFRVRTLGFRGEALASIGGIAQVTLQSRQPGDLAGAEVSCKGGQLAPVRDWNGTPGTRIEVRHLFYNTPVRRKFLKSPGTEIGHICEIVTRLALAQPGLHLVLTHNGKSVYEVAHGTSLADRIGLFFGPEIKEKLYALDVQQGPARLFGFVADPACERGNAKLQYLFLNGRWIRDRSLGHALQEAYRGLLMTGRYAVAFLFIELPPDQVDVNVHPTKAEVRFRDGGAVYSMVLGAIRQRLNAANLTARLRPPAPLGAVPVSALNAMPWLAPQRAEETPSLFSKPGLPSYTKNPLPPPDPEATRREPGGAWSAESEARSAEVGTRSAEREQARDATTNGHADALKAIQMHNAYLVLETPEGMLVIDQHALHERILFEQLKERLRAGTLEKQKLLIPEPVELTAEQAAKTLEHRAELSELGLEVDDFGGGTLLLTAYPALLSRTPPGEILKAVVDHLSSKERLPTREQLLSDLLSLMACHAAVRSGDTLTPEEIAELVSQRHLAHDAHHCPHGRPTALLFTRHDLDRQFRRI
ncbi:MAG: DNA mismatch repair endonuclease MutL [Gemmataceae bacterium]|nr:DNA mismatch repair endonuclease MutL [Gemmataceae bacterium]MCI0739559.1 DNA mismatch repair endonuclease MutL [Gemmataceae bacterium]